MTDRHRPSRTTLARLGVAVVALAAILGVAACGGSDTEGSGSSTYPTRVLVMTEPPSIDANEITDKGYINRRAVLERRAAQVEALYAGGEGVIQ